MSVVRLFECMPFSWGPKPGGRGAGMPCRGRGNVYTLWQTNMRLMEEFLHHLGCIKPCKQEGKLPMNRCKKSINSSNGKWTRIEDVFPIENGDIPAIAM